MSESGTQVHQITRADHCVIACADAWRSDGEIIASPTGIVPTVGARLARATFAPDLVLTDGQAYQVRGTWGLEDSPPSEIEGYMPFRMIFDVAAAGRRHVMMAPVQIDKYGNSNISCIGEFERPKVQLLGVRGAPGNTIHHATSYWMPKHTRQSFVPTVDLVCGIGKDRTKTGDPRTFRYHDLRLVISELAVFDFNGSGRMRIKSLHPGTTVDEVLARTGFELEIPAEIRTTRDPTAEELILINEVLDPLGRRLDQVGSGS